MALLHFSTNTAPVFDKDIKEDIMESKQYMKYGGRILPKFKVAGGWEDYLHFFDQRKK